MDSVYTMFFQIADLAYGIVDPGFSHIFLIFSVICDDIGKFLWNGRTGKDLAVSK